MKKLLFIILLVNIKFGIAQAQVIPQPGTIKSKPIKPTKLLSLQETAKAVEGLPDLTITSINVKQVSNPGGAKYLEINYTVKNEDTAPVDPSRINMTGRIKYLPQA